MTQIKCSTSGWRSIIADEFTFERSHTGSFRYIGQMISWGKRVMAGEESAGMSIRGHVPEKDGTLACLLVAELAASTGKLLSDINREMQQTYGLRLSVRGDHDLSEELVTRLRAILSSTPLEMAGHTALNLVTADGTKWLFENSDWVLLPLSGTEPVARLYVEASDQDRLERIEKAFSIWFIGSNGTAANSLVEPGK